MTAKDPRYVGTAMPDWDWWRLLWPDPEGALRALGAFFPGQRVLDLCCGDGFFTAPLTHILGDEGAVIGVDLDPAMLARNRQEVAARGRPIVRWIEADAARLADMKLDVCDAALFANTLHGVPDKLALARAVRALLRPGAPFAVINWHAAGSRDETPVLGVPRGPAPELRLSPEAAAAAVEPGGFRLIGVVELSSYHYGAVFAAA